MIEFSSTDGELKTAKCLHRLAVGHTGRGRQYRYKPALMAIGVEYADDRMVIYGLLE